MSDRPLAKRFYCLDIVRGLTALSVALGHTAAYIPQQDPTWFSLAIRRYSALFYAVFSSGTGRRTHPGVIIFIVLSGFCIHLPVAGRRERAKTPGFWREYAGRRVTRIAPVYWFCCALGLLCWWAVARRCPVPDWLGESSIVPFDVVRKFLFLDPLLPRFSITLGNGAVRTVATELWLYALYPIALYGVTWQRGRRIWLALGGLYAISLIFLICPPGPTWAYESVPRFFVWWTTGAVAAERFRTRVKTSRGWRELCIAGVLLALLIGVNLTLHFKGSYLVATPLLALFSGELLVSLMCLEQHGAFRANFAVRAIAYVGERSYSLYAIHMPVLGAVFLAMQYGWYQRMSHPIGNDFPAVMLIIAATLVTYRLVELPSHHWSKSLARRVPPTPDTAQSNIEPIRSAGPA